MMHNEFLEITGLSEKYISFSEYTTLIEPIYMNCKLPTKQDFCKVLVDTFKTIVYPTVEKKVKMLPTELKENYIFHDSDMVENEIAKVDFEARKIAYKYIELISNL